MPNVTSQKSNDKERKDRRRKMLDLLNSEEGKKKIEAVMKQANETAEAFRKAREIDPETLRTHMTL